MAEYISCDANVELYETVYLMYIYTMKEYADVFKSEKNIAKDFCCNDELVEEFIDFLNLDQTQCDTICVKTVQQGGSQFCIDQRTEWITASNFYKICHLKDTTDKTNTKTTFSIASAILKHWWRLRVCFPNEIYSLQLQQQLQLAIN